MEELLVVPCMAWSEVRMGAVVIRECVGLSLDQDRLSTVVYMYIRYLEILNISLRLNININILLQEMELFFMD